MEKIKEDEILYYIEDGSFMEQRLAKELLSARKEIVELSKAQVTNIDVNYGTLNI